MPAYCFNLLSCTMVCSLLMCFSFRLSPRWPTHPQRRFWSTTTEKETMKPESVRVEAQKNIVIIAGFENFNFQLYKKAGQIVNDNVPTVRVDVFTDRDISSNSEMVEKSLSTASVLFCSLLFDYSQIQWIKSKIGNIPTKFCFESALELMSETKVGDFTMAPKEGSKSGPPAPVKAILSQFGSKREEDKMTGYLNFLKVGPKLLQFVPTAGELGQKVKDLRTWLTVYSYWNQGALQNVVSMLYTIIKVRHHIDGDEVHRIICFHRTASWCHPLSSRPRPLNCR